MCAGVKMKRTVSLPTYRGPAAPSCGDDANYNRNGTKRGGDRTKKREEGEKNPRKKIQTLFLETGKEPATTSPHDMSERKCDTAPTNPTEPSFKHKSIQ